MGFLRRALPLAAFATVRGAAAESNSVVTKILITYARNSTDCAAHVEGVARRGWAAVAAGAGDEMPGALPRGMHEAREAAAMRALNAEKGLTEDAVRYVALPQIVAAAVVSPAGSVPFPSTFAKREAGGAEAVGGDEPRVDYSEHSRALFDEAIASVGEQRLAQARWLRASKVEVVSVASAAAAEAVLAAAAANPCVHSVELDSRMRPGRLGGGSGGGEFAEPAAGARAAETTPASSSSSTLLSLGSTPPVTSTKSTTITTVTSIDYSRSTLPSSGRSDVGTIWGALFSPNDSEYYRQFALPQMNTQKAWTMRDERAPSFGGGNVTVAVIDLGCNMDAVELAQVNWHNPNEICDNGVDDDDNGYIDDCSGWNFYSSSHDLTDKDELHGTPVSGAVLAQTNNKYGIASPCRNCELMCLRVGDTALVVSNTVEAMNYAAQMGAKVINMSSNGGETASQKRAIEALNDYDVALVVASGNEGCDIDADEDCRKDHGFPAGYNFPWMLSLGATNADGSLADYSNTGNTSVSVFAPSGVLVLSTGNSFGAEAGTSISSPQAAGGAALIRSTFPQLTAIQVLKALSTTCHKLDGLEGKAVCPGVVDFAAALTRAGQMAADAVGGVEFA